MQLLSPSTELTPIHRERVLWKVARHSVGIGIGIGSASSACLLTGTRSAGRAHARSERQIEMTLLSHMHAKAHKVEVQPEQALP
jgi:hypothetical protein